mgnify:CR=1 FL=1
MPELTLKVLALRRLERIKTKTSFVRSDAVIRFPSCFHAICSTLCLNKQEAWGLLKTMQAEGMIEIVPYHGVRLSRLDAN